MSGRTRSVRVDRRSPGHPYRTARTAPGLQDHPGDLQATGSRRRPRRSEASTMLVAGWVVSHLTQAVPGERHRGV
jgi:hypothetical protein